jgi:hypothetical protein
MAAIRWLDTNGVRCRRWDLEIVDHHHHHHHHAQHAQHADQSIAAEATAAATAVGFIRYIRYPSSTEAIGWLTEMMTAGSGSRHRSTNMNNFTWTLKR